MRLIRRLAAALSLGAVPAVLAAQEWRTDFSRRTVPLEEIVPGGPPKDGIPAIDRPVFESADSAGRWLADREPVAVVEAGDETRVYPLQILIWHEIVNDVVGGEPISVTFCPLCSTALAFDRRLDPPAQLARGRARGARGGRHDHDTRGLVAEPPAGRG